MNKQNYLSPTDEIAEVSKTLIDFFDKQILSLSEDQIDGVIGEIHNFAQDELEEFTVLARLLVHCDEKRLHYFAKQQERYNYDYLRHVIIWVIVILILGSSLCYIIVYYDCSYREKLDAVIHDLRQYDIIVKQCQKGPSFMRQYYFEVSVNRDLLENDYFVARNLFEQACQIHRELYGWIRRSIVIVGGFLWMAMCFCFEYLRKLFRPRYKEYHEQWCFLEYKLGQRKEEISVTE